MDTQEFMRRRRQFMRMIGKDSIAILPAAPSATATGGRRICLPQDSHFHYLTGFPEPDAVAVLVPGRATPNICCSFRERDREQELWKVRGRHRGCHRTLRRDDAFPITDIDDILPG